MRGPESFFKLVNELKKLPGIGRKTAERLAFHLLKSQKDNIDILVEAITEVKNRVRFCSICNSFTEIDPCDICSDPNREKNILCVVEEPHDVFAIEKTREYKGGYHVLLGVLSPLDGVGPSDLKIDELVKRAKENGIKEVILATNPNLEGEATAMYIAKILKPFGMKITRIARGLPVGGDLEYADEVTLTKSMEGRQEM